MRRIRQSTPIKMSERPMMFRTSTRSKSVQGAHPQAQREFLKTKKQSQGEDFRSAEDRGARDFIGRRNPFAACGR